MVRASTGVLTALTGPRLERVAWLFLAVAALGVFCDHAAHQTCAPPAGLRYEANRVRRETKGEFELPRSRACATSRAPPWCACSTTASAAPPATCSPTSA